MGRRRRLDSSLAAGWLIALAAGWRCAAAVGAHAGSAVRLRPSFLAKRTHGSQPPKVCVNAPTGWYDVTMNSCADYGTKQFCTADGGYGPGWDKATWGEFSRWSLYSPATSACCVCGGGKQGDAPACSTFTCPSGYSQKADAAKTYCKAFSCTLEDDLDTCCEAPAEVQAAVQQTKDLIATLKEAVKNNVTTEGGALLERFTADVDAVKKDKIAGMEAAWKTERDQAIAKAKQQFDRDSHDSDKIGAAARYEIAVAGFVAARDEMANSQIDSYKLQTAMESATRSFLNSQQVWKETGATGLALQKLSGDEWAAHHADLNATWPLVLKGIEELNGAIEQSSSPGNDVRWAAQSSRLASDLTQTAKSNAQGIMAQAEAAESRATAALDLTGSNSGKLDKLEAVVAQLESSHG